LQDAGAREAGMISLGAMAAAALLEIAG